MVDTVSGVFESLLPSLLLVTAVGLAIGVLILDVKKGRDLLWPHDDFPLDNDGSRMRG